MGNLIPDILHKKTRSLGNVSIQVTRNYQIEKKAYNPIRSANVRSPPGKESLEAKTRSTRRPGPLRLVLLLKLPFRRGALLPSRSRSRSRSLSLGTRSRSRSLSRSCIGDGGLARWSSSTSIFTWFDFPRPSGMRRGVYSRVSDPREEL